MKVVVTFIDRITMLLNVVGTLLILALMVLICSDVIARGLFSSPISGVPELVSLSIVAIVFLQAPEAFRRGRFTRSEAILNFLERKSKRLRALLESIFAFLALSIVAVLFYASYPLFQKSWDRGTFIGTVGDFIAPVWPVKLIILIGCVALIAQIAIQMFRQLAFLFGQSNATDNNTGAIS